jgi:hypothetical protein
MRSDLFKRYIVPTFILALAIWLFFRWMGGGETRVYELIDAEPVDLYGYEFRGRPNADELEAYFFEIRDQTSFEDEEYLTVVTFGKEKAVDTLHQFLGTQRELQTNDELKKYTVPGGAYVKVVLRMNSMVRPSPGKVREEAEEFAQDNRIELMDWNLEIFTGEDELTVLFPAKN